MEFVRSEGLPIHIKSWCRDVEESAMAQAENLARHPALRRHVALMPDCHCGIGMPVCLCNGAGLGAVRCSMCPVFIWKQSLESLCLPAGSDRGHWCNTSN